MRADPSGFEDKYVYVTTVRADRQVFLPLLLRPLLRPYVRVHRCTESPIPESSRTPWKRLSGGDPMCQMIESIAHRIASPHDLAIR